MISNRDGLASKRTYAAVAPSASKGFAIIVTDMMTRNEKLKMLITINFDDDASRACKIHIGVNSIASPVNKIKRDANLSTRASEKYKTSSAPGLRAVLLKSLQIGRVRSQCDRSMRQRTGVMSFGHMLIRS